MFLFSLVMLMFLSVCVLSSPSQLLYLY